MITCQYCGKENTETAKICWRCGAPKPDEDPVIKGNPFYYQGYMVWPEKKYDRLVYHFWLGPQYVHTIDVEYRSLMELVAPGEDFIHLIYDMFKLAIGEEEVITIEHKNEYHLVMFEIKRTEH